MMKIVNDYPPNFSALENKFGTLPKGTVFTWGEIIYSPYYPTLSDDLIEHERIHSIQQAGDPEGWWKRYIEEDQFRLEQEVEAYQAQYKFYCQKQKDRNARTRFLNMITIHLSSKMYGNIIGYREAMQAIKKGKLNG